MCMQDIDIGRQCGFNLREKTLVVGETYELLEPNPNRQAIWFPSVQNAIVQLKPMNGTIDTTSGVGFRYFHDLLLTLQEHGGLVTVGWFATVTVANCDYFYGESLFYPDKYEAEKWRSQDRTTHLKQGVFSQANNTPDYSKPNAGLPINYQGLKRPNNVGLSVQVTGP
jgi:hypothetical protein